MRYAQDEQTDVRTMLLLYASLSSFEGIKSPIFERLPFLYWSTFSECKDVHRASSGDAKHML